MEKQKQITNRLFMGLYVLHLVVQLINYNHMLVKVGIRLEIQVVQLQIMEKQKQITNPIIHQHNSTLCGISSNAGSMVV